MLESGWNRSVKRSPHNKTKLIGTNGGGDQQLKCKKVTTLHMQSMQQIGINGGGDPQLEVLSVKMSPYSKFDPCSELALIVVETHNLSAERLPYSECGKLVSMVVGTHNLKS